MLSNTNKKWNDVRKSLKLIEAADRHLVLSGCLPPPPPLNYIRREETTECAQKLFNRQGAARSLPARPHAVDPMRMSLTVATRTSLESDA